MSKKRGKKKKGATTSTWDNQKGGWKDEPSFEIISDKVLIEHETDEESIFMINLDEIDESEIDSKKETNDDFEYENYMSRYTY